MVVDKISKLLTPQKDTTCESQYKEDCDKITKAIAPLEQIQVRRQWFVEPRKSQMNFEISIDLVSIDSQSVGKRTYDLMDTVNTKKRWKTFCWRVN
jgi:hypothetical protein